MKKPRLAFLFSCSREPRSHTCGTRVADEQRDRFCTAVFARNVKLV
jgi:hypothetical protein